MRLTADAALKISLLPLATLLVWAIAGTAREPHRLTAGDPAPDFAVLTDRGARLTPRQFGGRVLVLNFWATWCLPCVQETPSLNAFQSALRDSGVVVLAISIDRDERAYRAFLRRFGIGFATARDPERRVSTSYGTVQIPESYIIDRRGAVVARLISDQDWMSPDILRFVQSLP